MEKTVHLLIMYTMLVLTLLLFHKGRKHPQSLMLAIFATVQVLTNGLNTLSLSAGDDFFIRFEKNLGEKLQLPCFTEVTQRVVTAHENLGTLGSQ